MSTRARTAFAVCIDNDAYAASLIRWKIYRTLADAHATRLGLIRVVDESGEDYLYPKPCFRPIPLPATLRRLFRSRKEHTA